MNGSAINLKGKTAPRELVTDLYLITLLFVFPLFPGFSGYEHITLAKYVFLLSATGIYLAALIVLMLTGIDRSPLPRFSAPQWAAIAFLLAVMFSALLSPWFPDTLLGGKRYGGLMSLAVYVLIFLCASSFTRPKPIHAAALCTAAALCCALAVLQLAGKNPLHLYPNNLRWQDAGIRYSGAYLGTIGNTNLLDAVLCLVIPCCICILLLSRKWLYAVPLVLSVGIIIAAGGSGAIVSLFAFVIAALLLLPRKRKARILCALVAAVLVLGALGAILFLPVQSGTLYELLQMLHGNFDDSFGSSRIRIWRECLALVPERPLLGGGPGTLGQRLDILFSRYVPETGITLRSYVDNAHSVYLGYLVNTGILGFAAYLTLLVCCARRALMLFRSSALIAAFSLAVFCGAVHACFGLGLCITEPVFFALLGLCCPFYPISEKEDSPE